MRCVIDANVLKGYYHEIVLSKPHGLSAEPSQVFRLLGGAFTAFLDDEGHIEHEWESQVGTEWLRAWLVDKFDEDAIRQIHATDAKDLISALKKLGFPRKGDTWYVRVAAAASDQGKEESVIITEDIDFINPKKKNCPAPERTRIIRSCKGPVADLLVRNGVQVATVTKCVVDAAE